MNQHHRCCTFASPGLPTIGGYPGESRRETTYAIGIVLFKINLHAGDHSFAACGNVVRMCDEKKYNPQGGSLLACIVTQGRLRCTCQPCAIESITPMGYGHTAWFGAIECAIRWGMNTPCVWRGLSNVQCNAVGAHCVVWWRWVGAVPVCPPVSPHKGASIIHSPRIMRVFLVWKRRYADVRAGTQATPLRFRLGGLRVGGFVCWENGAHEPTPSVLYF